MGNIHRIKRNLNNGIPLAKTGITFGGSVVCLISDDITKAQAFKESCLRNAYRAGLMNIGDLYIISSQVRDKAIKGESIWN